jgi:hypothetical protein
MKKTIQKHKLQLSKTTVRQLSGSDLTRAAGALGLLPTLAATCSFSCFLDSCHHSDCCLVQ